MSDKPNLEQLEEALETWIDSVYEFEPEILARIDPSIGLIVSAAWAYRDLLAEGVLDTRGTE